MTKWVEDTKKEFEKKVSYQVGFAPPAATETTEHVGLASPCHSATRWSSCRS